MDWEIDEEIIKKIIGEYFFRNGYFKTGQIFEKEEKLVIDKDQFINLNELLKSIDKKDFELLYKWSSENDKELEEQIYELNFIELLKQGNIKNCLEFSKKLKNHKNFKHFMGSIIYIHKLQDSPYSFMLKEDKWKSLKQDLIRLYFKKIGKSSNCHLKTCLSCGIISFPSILKYVSKDFDLIHVNHMSQLPIELDLSNQFIFQSIFTCPVSKEISTKDNPPFALLCGHVISKTSIEKLVRGNRSIFKCPYCPTENTKSKCTEIKNLN